MAGKPDSGGEPPAVPFQIAILIEALPSAFRPKEQVVKHIVLKYSNHLNVSQFCRYRTKKDLWGVRDKGLREATKKERFLTVRYKMEKLHRYATKRTFTKQYKFNDCILLNSTCKKTVHCYKQYYT